MSVLVLYGSWEEYKANLKSSGNVYGKPAEILHLHSIAVIKITVKHNSRLPKFSSTIGFSCL